MPTKGALLSWWQGARVLRGLLLLLTNVPCLLLGAYGALHLLALGIPRDPEADCLHDCGPTFDAILGRGLLYIASGLVASLLVSRFITRAGRPRQQWVFVAPPTWPQPPPGWSPPPGWRPHPSWPIDPAWQFWRRTT